MTFKAFRYEAGVYTVLQTEPGEQSWALGTGRSPTPTPTTTYAPRGVVVGRQLITARH